MAWLDCDSIDVALICMFSDDKQDGGERKKVIAFSITPHVPDMHSAA